MSKIIHSFYPGFSVYIFISSIDNFFYLKRVLSFQNYLLEQFLWRLKTLLDEITSLGVSKYAFSIKNVAFYVIEAFVLTWTHY